MTPYFFTAFRALNYCLSTTLFTVLLPKFRRFVVSICYLMSIAAYLHRIVFAHIIRS